MKLPRKIIIGNWKMHTTVPEGSVLLHKIHGELKHVGGVDIVLCPPFTSVYCLSREAAKLHSPEISIGAQNVADQAEGSYTGEVSAEMLKGSAEYVIVGHSSRRQEFGEKDEVIAQKVQLCLSHKLTPVLCVGETHKERADGSARQVILDQINTDLHNVTATELSKAIIAYEPIWAIGNGNFAKPGQVEEMIMLIRNLLAQRYGRLATEGVRVLYGGSVTHENAKSYLGLPGVDGLLVGGASLRHKEFSEIVRAAAGVGISS